MFRVLEALQTSFKRGCLGIQGFAIQGLKGLCIAATGLIVEARKLEHHSPHALKVKYKGS